MLTNAQIRRLPALRSWFKNTGTRSVFLPAGSLWHLAGHHVGTDEVSHEECDRAAQASSNQNAFRDHLWHRPAQHDAQDQKA